MCPLRSPESRSKGLAGVEWVQPPHVLPEALRWKAFWIATIGGLGVLDTWRASKHDGSTLSEHGRLIIRTDTPTGKVLFSLGCIAFWHHILK